MIKHVAKAMGEVCSEPNFVGEYISRAKKGGDFSYRDAGWELWDNLHREVESRFSAATADKVVQRMQELFEEEENYLNALAILRWALPDVMKHVPQRRLLDFFTGFAYAVKWANLVGR